MAVSPNVVPVELIITPLLIVGGEPQETAIIHNKMIKCLYISDLRLQVRDDPLHILLDRQVLVVVDEDSWYPIVVQLCIAMVPCSLGVEIGL